MIPWKSGGPPGKHLAALPFPYKSRVEHRRGGFPPFTPWRPQYTRGRSPATTWPWVPMAWRPWPPLSEKREGTPYLGPSQGVRPCGARKARRFSPRKSLKNGPLRYALTRRPEQSGGTHPLKGVRPEKIQRKRGQKNEIHHQEENETGKADRLRRPKAYVPTRAKT